MQLIVIDPQSQCDNQVEPTKIRVKKRNVTKYIFIFAFVEVTEFADFWIASSIIYRSLLLSWQRTAQRQAACPVCPSQGTGKSGTWRRKPPDAETASQAQRAAPACSGTGCPYRMALINTSASRASRTRTRLVTWAPTCWEPLVKPTAASDQQREVKSAAISPMGSIFPLLKSRGQRSRI
jgi:hypothetical protein